jgi:hypothetical protein
LLSSSLLLIRLQGGELLSSSLLHRPPRDGLRNTMAVSYRICNGGGRLRWTPKSRFRSCAFSSDVICSASVPLCVRRTKAKWARLLELPRRGRTSSWRRGTPRWLLAHQSTQRSCPSTVEGSSLPALKRHVSVALVCVALDLELHRGVVHAASTERLAYQPPDRRERLNGVRVDPRVR